MIQTRAAAQGGAQAATGSAEAAAPVRPADFSAAEIQAAEAAASAAAAVRTEATDTNRQADMGWIDGILTLHVTV